MKSILDVDGLTIKIPDKTLFKDLNFSIPQNQLTCITGENGVGKSTLVKHLLQDLDHNYTEHTHFKITRDQVQYVPQLRNIDDEYPLQIRDFVSLGFKHRILPWNSKSMNVKLDGILNDTKLMDIQKRPLGRASGGEKQRAYLAQALCSDPELLILDEATASLDRNAKHFLLKLLKDIIKKRELTVLFITHDPELIDTYADYELNLANQTCHMIKKGAA
ncbi:metal ABC transporter ATP-binding protein [Ligilactobacillus sp. LYQ135]